ncbi:hypothetical protein PENTCL1PPCAC_19264 [Pristionchus entomophagus]|uniref:F-box domain-containing protein n=1 Tax=Pristionchus entomophagus TaxID=358040 RepID=A0AAV5TSW9_9BILA|nr:hypothetical protein PENTCL1PPCAC_19264 [Pristionchus entomophagus]
MIRQVSFKKDRSSLSRSAAVAAREKWNVGKTTGEKTKRQVNGYFSILVLPTELISHTFSFLSMEDRMRARVNKKLDVIEANSKYFVRELRITPRYSVDAIRRISQNASIGHLEISITCSNELDSEIYDIIKDFDIGHLHLENECLCNDKLKETMVDSFLLDLTKACKSLHVNECNNITPDALYQVYKNILDGSSKLRVLFISDLLNYQCISFLNLIGIIYRDEQFFSNRDIEVYKDEESEFESLYIFDGCLEIVLTNDIIERIHGCFKLEFHETQESLENEKRRRGLVRVQINRE